MSYYQVCPICKGEGVLANPERTCHACKGKGVLFVEEPVIPNLYPIPFAPPYHPLLYPPPDGTMPYRPDEWVVTYTRTGPPPDVQG